MTFLPLLNEDTNSVLTVKSVDSYKEDRVNIPNNAALLTLAPHLADIADHLGIDLEEAEYTFTVSKGRDGYIAYQPYVAARADVPGIVWGKLFVPLSGIQGLTLEQDEKQRPIFVVELANEKTYKFPMMFPKDAKVDYPTARQAFKKGNIAALLSKGFEKPNKLSELEKGDYSITAIREANFKGEVNYEIFLQNQGWYKTNAKIRRKIEAGLKVSEQEPAQLTVHGEVSKTATGYSVIGVDILSKHELDLPAFVF